MRGRQENAIWMTGFLIALPLWIYPLQSNGLVTQDGMGEERGTEIKEIP